jgi:hypothetical protein
MAKARQRPRQRTDYIGQPARFRKGLRLGCDHQYSHC